MAKILCFRGISDRPSGQPRPWLDSFVKALRGNTTSPRITPPSSHGTRLLRVRERGRVGASKCYLGLHASGRKERPAADKYSL